MKTDTPTEPTVVSIASFRGNQQQNTLSQLEAYWDDLRRGRIMPARSEIDPRGIIGALEHAFILERVAKGLGRFRLAGMHLNDLMGMEVRGMPMTAMITPNSRETVSSAIEAVFDEPAVVRMSLSAECSLSKPRMDAQLLLLPLRSDLGDVSRILGCLVAEGKIGRAPRRFAVTTQSRRTLIGFGDRRPEPRQRVEGFAEASAEVHHVRPTTKRGRPCLTVVPSDR